jgi:rubredoxin
MSPISSALPSLRECPACSRPDTAQKLVLSDRAWPIKAKYFRCTVCDHFWLEALPQPAARGSRPF